MGLILLDSAVTGTTNQQNWPTVLPVLSTHPPVLLADPPAPQSLKIPTASLFEEGKGLEGLRKIHWQQE